MTKFVQWCEKHVTSLGRLTLMLGVAMAVFGFPMQIWKSYVEQKVGLHIGLIVLPLFVFAVRVPYSIGKKAWHLVLPDLVGFISCCVLLGQYLYYSSG